MFLDAAQPLRTAMFALVAAAASVYSSSAAAATISGTVGERGVVWVKDGQRLPLPIERLMVNHSKSFAPDLIVVTIGTSVRFPNDDPYMHSIYASSGPNPFDIGFYGTGPGKTVVMSRAGIDSLRCHLHPQMHATIVAVDGPSTVTAEDGRFTLPGVFAGNVEVHAWTPAGGVRSHKLRILHYADALSLPGRL